jgi:hypothetical protein
VSKCKTKDSAGHCQLRHNPVGQYQMEPVGAIGARDVDIFAASDGQGLPAPAQGEQLLPQRKGYRIGQMAQRSCITYSREAVACLCRVGHLHEYLVGTRTLSDNVIGLSPDQNALVSGSFAIPLGWHAHARWATQETSMSLSLTRTPGPGVFHMLYRLYMQ